LATAGAVAVANVYYLQPLLELIAQGFGVSEHEAGYVSVGMQTGYALGILAFVPLGDIVDRRRMLLIMFVLVSAFLVAATFAPTVQVLALTMLAIGICTTAPQVLVPFAADVAPPLQRGRAIGIMQTGLILGTLFARVAGGFIGAHFGWRAVFGFAAVVMALASLAVARVLPHRPPHATIRYGELVRSIFGYVARYPVLRASMWLGMMTFGSFTGIWTVFAFHLHDLGYGSDVVGLIGLLSLITAFLAGWIGVLADRRGTLRTGTIGWLWLTLTMVLFLTVGWTIWGVILASAIFPLGTQFTHISNQTRIFGIDDRARSRINTAYTFAMFGGGSLGALVATLAWQVGNWNAVCILQLVQVGAMGPALWWLRRLRERERAAAA
jgi:predicted MFS family arabinose efflux permease